MKLAPLLLAVCAASAASAAQPRTPIELHRYAADGWLLEVRRNTFTGETQCTLDNDRIRYQPGALGFRTHATRGVSDAWYRIDQAPARAWRDLYPRLVDQNAAIETGGLDNPTGGIVWLPLADVEHAHVVTVETRMHGRLRLRRFPLDGFAYMHDAAIRLGCPARGSVG